MRTFTLATFFELLGTTVPISELRAHCLRGPASPCVLDRQTARDHIEDLEHLQPDTDTRLRRSVRWQLRSALRR